MDVWRNAGSAAAVSFLLLATGCYSVMYSGHEFDRGVVDRLRKGVTTRAQVRELLGAPQSVVVDSQGNRVWVYNYAVSEAWIVPVVPVYTLFTIGREKSSGHSLSITFSGDVVAAYELTVNQDYFFSEPERAEPEDLAKR